MAWATAQSPAAHELPAGSAVVFVCDGRLPITAKAGSSTRVRLRDELVLDGTVIAPAGTPARLVVAGTTTVGGKREALVAVEDFKTAYGLLPLRARGSLPAIEPGVTVGAATLARVAHLHDRFAIEIPFPFAVSTEVPISVYTPTPAKTAAPILRPTPKGASTASPKPTP